MLKSDILAELLPWQGEILTEMPGSLTHTFSIFFNRKPSAGFFLSNLIRIFVALYSTITL